MAVRPEGMIGDKSWVDRAGFVVANGGKRQRSDHGRRTDGDREKFHFAQ